MGPFWVCFQLYYRAKKKFLSFCFRFTSAEVHQSEVARINEESLAKLRFFSTELLDTQRNATNIAYEQNFDINAVMAEAERISRHQFTFFSRHRISIQPPIQWQYDYMHGIDHGNHHFWTDAYRPAHGDIKCVWEINRFTWIIPLLKASLLSADESHAEYFWQWYSDWVEQNPVNTGVNWVCGQEVSIRLLMILFAISVFRMDEDKSVMSLEAVSNSISQMASRVYRNTSYAKSQKNNHALSEGAILWIVGTTFSEYKESAKWQKRGLKYLIWCAENLIDNEGCFSQYSTNYHRLMLQWYLIIFLFAKRNQIQLPQVIQQKVYLAYMWLLQRTDPLSGHAPNTGSNDGALLLPLSQCDYQDYRPTLQAMSLFFDGVRVFEPGLWDEEAFWLIGTDCLHAPVREVVRQQQIQTSAGFDLLRQPKQWLMIRSPKLNFRPSQSDGLHIDLHWQGINIIRDPGTYSYNRNHVGHHQFSEARFHNSVTCHGESPMRMISQFMRYPWVDAVCEPSRCHHPGDIVVWQYYQKYRNSTGTVMQRRVVVSSKKEEIFVVIDSLQCRNENNFELHYIFPDVDYDWSAQSPQNLTLKTDKGPYHIYVSALEKTKQQLIRADKKSGYGWYCDGYFSLKPALSMLTSLCGKACTIVTVLSPNRVHVKQVKNKFELSMADRHLEIDINEPGGEEVIRSIQEYWPETNTHKQLREDTFI